MVATHMMYDEYVKPTGAPRARFRVGQRKSTLWIYAVPTSATSTRLIINSGTDGQPSLPWHKRLVRSLQPRCGPTTASRQPCRGPRQLRQGWEQLRTGALSAGVCLGTLRCIGRVWACRQ